MKRILVLLLTIAVVLGLCATASAADTGIYSKNIRLTVEYIHDGTPVADAAVRLYKVASMDESFHTKTDPTFADFRDHVESKDTSWDILAQSLLQYIQEENIACDEEIKTDKDGIAKFPTGKTPLNPGIYLIYCPNYRYDSRIYYASPAIISLPNYGADGQLTNQITAKVKFYSIDDVPLELTVKKYWDDTGYEKKRPDTITVQLLKNNKIVPGATVILSEDNKWTAKWENLDPLDNWSVKETKVKGYKEPTYSWEKDGNVLKCTITNTYGSTTGSKLPQTGQLTWPIPIMTISGMVLFAVGWWLCFGRKDTR